MTGLRSRGAEGRSLGAQSVPPGTAELGELHSGQSPREGGCSPTRLGVPRGEVGCEGPGRGTGCYPKISLDVSCSWKSALTRPRGAWVQDPAQAASLWSRFPREETNSVQTRLSGHTDVFIQGGPQATRSPTPESSTGRGACRGGSEGEGWSLWERSGGGATSGSSCSSRCRGGTPARCLHSLDLRPEPLLRPARHRAPLSPPPTAGSLQEQSCRPRPRGSEVWTPKPWPGTSRSQKASGFLLPQRLWPCTPSSGQGADGSQAPPPFPGSPQVPAYRRGRSRGTVPTRAGEAGRGLGVWG